MKSFTFSFLLLLLGLNALASLQGPLTVRGRVVSMDEKNVTIMTENDQKLRFPKEKVRVLKKGGKLKENAAVEVVLKK